MRWLVLVSLLLLTSCSGGWEARNALGTEKDGARYGSVWLFGGPSIYIYPSGTVHRRYEGGTRDMRVGQQITYIDKALWARIAKLVRESGGKNQQDLTNREDAICDGGYEYLHIRVGDKNAYYIADAMGCEEYVEQHDAAGRELIEIFRELADSIDKKLS